MAQEPVINLWPGSSTFATGKTPYGYFDADTEFVTDIDKFTNWAAKRLGYPIVDVELIDVNFYAAFEEAVMKYGYYLHTYASRDLLMDVKGSPIGELDFSQNFVQPSLGGTFKLADQYGIAAPAGGNAIHYQGFVTTKPGEQVYDLSDTNDTTLEDGDVDSNNFTIRKLYHERTPASVRQIGSAGGIHSGQALVNQFGFNAVASDYLLTPLNTDASRMQAIELNDTMRRSEYSFKMTGSRLRIFPIPQTVEKIFFDYTLDDEIIEATDQSGEIIADASNIPYGNISYSGTNSIARSWMKRYALALCKEMLGFVLSLIHI